MYLVVKIYKKEIIESLVSVLYTPWSPIHCGLIKLRSSSKRDYPHIMEPSLDIILGSGGVPRGFSIDISHQVSEYLYHEKDLDTAYALDNFFAILNCEFDYACKMLRGCNSNLEKEEKREVLKTYLLFVVEANYPGPIEIQIPYTEGA